VHSPIYRRRTSRWIAGLALAAGLAACGGSSDTEQVRRTAEAFTGAILRGDGAAACAGLSDDAAASMISRFGARGQRTGGDCAGSILRFGRLLGKTRLAELRNAAKGLGTSVHSGTGAVETPHSALAVSEVAGEWKVIKVELFVRR
jgi:hypothetical protein